MQRREGRESGGRRCCRARGKLGIKEISERVGHSSAVMTLDRYAHAPTDAHDRVPSALDAMAAPAPKTNVIPIHRDEIRHTQR